MAHRTPAAAGNARGMATRLAKAVHQAPPRVEALLRQQDVVGTPRQELDQRWSNPGLRGVLTLRALQQTDRLPRFLKHLSRRNLADVAEAA